ncbi:MULTISPECIES: hypothetical protein [unclassified Cryobacterium]|uniref:hypothetical protein n=1 Tax=unclassified Cryobacterium TaxID=2649013 RepID=UPI0010691DC1|nr:MULTISPECIES: hypothetical protein [unclassified Cryobacterium]TFC54539.1 hypothetical protein E3O68_09355 [Cryobacterium sp. TMB3-1-2]TFC70879.1 hypothetical protein E3T21_09275 [Cryobacterium sp. TMB3-15]TFC77332.1 hypothetical protein E3T22_06395 [Cryobacterium sp. TMB3-10]TFD45266.1 hypothetical protein E3T58_03020 [Cryobacterium sp. TMB3-12]
MIRVRQIEAMPLATSARRMPTSPQRGEEVIEIASCFIGLGLTALALSGCAAASAEGIEPTAASPANSLTPAEVKSAAVPNEEFSSAVGPVLESFPNDYAFFYFDSELKPVIGFTNEAVPAVLAAVKSTGQPAQILEDSGFTDAEYNATAEQLVADLQATWPTNVPFPMIGARPDFGVGVLGVTRIADEGSSDAARLIQESTRLIEEADVGSPFSVQVDKNVLGPGKPATAVDR